MRHSKMKLGFWSIFSSAVISQDASHSQLFEEYHRFYQRMVDQDAEHLGHRYFPSEQE